MYPVTWVRFLVQDSRKNNRTGILTGQGYLASSKSLRGGALERERDRKKKHTETPGVRGEMRTGSPDPNRHQQRRGETGKVEEGWGDGGVKVTEARRL